MKPARSVTKHAEILPGLWRVGGGSWGGVTDVLSVEGSGNVYLVGGQGRFALIDAGIPEGAERVLAAAAGVGAKAGDIGQILLTHSHGDHAAGTPALLAATGATAAAAEIAARAFGGDEAAAKALFIRPELRFEVGCVLRDGMKLAVGPIELTVLATPGHTPCGVCFAGRIEGRLVLLTGDTAIGDQGSARGVVGWLDGHWRSNPKHLLAGLRRLAAMNADILAPGHGRPILGAAAVGESLAHCIERVQQLLAIGDLHTMMPLDMTD